MGVIPQLSGKPGKALILKKVRVRAKKRNEKLVDNVNEYVNFEI